MSLNELLQKLSELGVKLWSEGGNLRVQAPKDSLTPELRDLLRLRKTELLSLLMQSAPTKQIVPIPRNSEGSDNFPLSFAQQRLWFLDQLEGPRATYNIPTALRMAGRLDVIALQHCLDRIVQRHEVLHTHFATVDGVGAQIIAPHLEVPLPLIDLQTLGESVQQTEVQRLVTQEAQQPFDLSTGPLFRATLLRLAPEEHVLLLTMHHIVSDGGSLGVLVKEISALYQAYITDMPAVLPKLPIQYVDFVHWQRQWLQGEVLQSQIDYWKMQLDGVPPLLELPTDHPRPTVQRYQGSQQSLSISAGLTQKLEELSRQHGVTLFMTLLGAYALLLSRYSGQQDMVIGSPITNRNRGEIENLIGFFVNTLALRVDLGDNPSFEQLLERVRQVALGAYAHQDLPFEKLVEELQPERSLSHSPLFQVVFVLQNTPMGALQLPELQLSLVEIRNTTAKVDLTLSLWETADGLTGWWEYNSDLFEQETIERLNTRFQILLEGIVAQPEQQIQALPLLTNAERQQLLYDFNDTTVEFPSDLCLHQLFEQQVKRTPDAIALVYEQHHLTYQQLNQKANQLAHYLQSLGVGPEVIVGLCVERSIDMVVGLLGTLKAGGAYLPLDPSYPQERLAFMMKDSNAALVLSERSIASVLSSSSRQVLLFDELQPTLAPLSTQPPSCAADHRNLAYVIYTSGSTGVPKGVMVTHQSICNHMLWMKRAFRLTSADRVLQKTPFSFDASVWEFYAPLIIGGQLMIACPGGHRDGNYLIQTVMQEEVTVIQLVPSLLRVLLEKEGLENCKSLRHIICGGEQLPRELLQNLSARFSSFMYNFYGPTEACIDATWWTYQETEKNAVVPIGRPIANTQIYILDEQRQPVPIGVAGELYIGGVGVARGYLNRLELTAEKFIGDPFSDRADGRLYRTGDLGRWRYDGQLEFLGRIDHQVKLRGFRIELGEIEAMLTQHPTVQQAVVTLKREQADNEQLVAYVVPSESETIALEPLREYLKSKLPEYMVPALFVELEALPLTVNGKVDRKALPALEGSELSTAIEYVPPKTPTEELLAQLWSEVLNKEQIGIRDNFFELGGHSLLATQLISRVREVFKVELPLRALFEQPTIGGLAQALQRGERAASPIVPAERDEQRLPLSFAQQRLWFLAQLEGPSATYNMPMALRLTGDLDIAALPHCLAKIVQRHEVLRTHFAVVDGVGVQIIASHLEVFLPLIDLQELSEPIRQIELQRLLIQEAQQPFDLSTGPLLRLTLLCLAPEEHVLMLTMHHIVSDGWSMGVLVQEVAALYQAYITDMPVTLPRLPIQYADFAHWQRQWLQGEVLQAHVDYWKEQLVGVPPLLELPTDHPRPAIQSFQGSRLSFGIPAALTQKLQKLSHQHGVTLFMTLLGAYSILLSRYSGQQDIVIGSPIANRNRGETENLIGFFVNMLALRIDLGDNPSFEQLLERVRQVALGAYAHQDLPFEQLVEELQPERSLSRSPLFQVAFALQNAPMDALQLPELQLVLVEAPNTTAKFDLTLALQETANGLVGNWEYSSDLFDEVTIARFSAHLHILLESIVAEPGKKIQDLPLLTAPERQQLIYDFNGTTTDLDFPSELCIHQLFEQQAERTPDAIALVYEQQQLTYRQLNQRANQLAHHLQSLGVGLDVIVGLCVERSIEVVVGLLGILKAGGAYLPLDPSYPQERLAFMMKDSNAALVLIQAKLIAQLPEYGVQVVCLDADWRTIAQQSRANLPARIQSENLAYVIYTSGSTGTPKGVLVEHHNVVRLFAATRSWFSFSQLDVWTLFHSYAFDFSVWELWGALLHSGRLVVVPYWISRSAENFYELLCKEQVTVLSQTPSAFHQFMQGEELRTPERLNLRLIIFGGEALDLKNLKPWFERYGDERPQLVNMYGITETTVHATYRPLKIADLDGLSSIIGGPIPDLQIYLLDDSLQPVPIGVAGELFIGGAGLARGYLNRPELTAEKFIADPFSDKANARLYRTGDLGRWRANGQLEYLGRIDHQVKLRGFRIELGEIEAALNEHPAVTQAVVVLRGDKADDKQLVAYVVSNLQAEGLRAQADVSQAEYLADWQQTYEQLYSQTSNYAEDLTFNIVGWNSSYTGLPIAPKEMQEWVEYTVAQILELQPKKVLEIGCGTGLLLFRIAPHCEQYWGTDYSQEVLQHLQQMKQSRPELGHVTLLQQMADDFEGIEAKAFDTVIINSVVQYFPSIDYLMNVLEGAIHAVKPGGFIFLGDIRSLPLLEAYHTSVELYKAPDSLSLEELQQRTHQRSIREEELVIDPAFFAALKQHFPQIRQVQVQPKRGRYQNELTRFRYEAILQIGLVETVGPEVTAGELKLPRLEILWQDWQSQKSSIGDIRKLLLENEPASLGLRRVSNARVQMEVKTLESFGNLSEMQTVAQLRTDLSKVEHSWIKPEELWALSDELPYVIEVSWCRGCSDGSYDVVFKHCSAVGEVIFEEPRHSMSWSAYGNVPLQGKLFQKLVPQLRQLLSQKLPEYMVPSGWMTLDSLPLTTNGKIDRKALPSPQPVGSTVSFVEPQTPTQELLVQIWSELLHQEPIGIHDNFFELGGHSLLATQLISRIRDTFANELSVRAVFEQPTIALLAKVLQQGEQTASAIVPIAREEQLLPLSFAQQRLWFLAQLEGPSATYNIPVALRLKGALDVAALEHCLTRIVQRHEVLRTHFAMVDGVAVQIIAPHLAIPLPVIDLQESSQPIRQLEVQRLVSQEAQQPFALSTGPLLRMMLVHLAAEEHVLLLNMHHIVSDGWSMGVLVKEVTTLYQAYVANTVAVLPELPIQYADFAYWQRQWLQGEVLQAHVDYWKEHLAGAPPLLELPTDYPRPSVQSFGGAKIDFSISTELAQKLEELSHQHGVTLFMTLLGAYAVLLSRYSGQQDMVIGSPIANRNRGEIENLIGFFVNTLALRIDLRDNPSFERLLERVREVTLGAYAHQDVPFEKLVEELQPQRSMSHSPLFQVMFVLQNAPMGVLELSDLRLEPLGDESTVAKFDLTLSFQETADGLRGSWEYNRNLFKQGTIERLNIHFRMLLEGIVAVPAQQIKELPLLTAVERQQLLYGFNDTAVDYPADSCIHQLFEQQAERTPDAIALVYEKQQLTYRQLNQRANQLAHYLQSLGVGPDVIVGLCVERSLEMVIGLLGILKAGGAYLPLDLTYPQERLVFMIEDAQAFLVLSEHSIASVLSRSSVRLLLLDKLQPVLAALSKQTPTCAAEPKNLAYVIYTSGSTGIPKGVMVEQHSLCNLVKWHHHTYQVRQQDRATQLAAFGFDAAVWEIWPYLTCGASLYLAEPPLLTAPDELITWLRRQQITISFLPTPLTEVALDLYIGQQTVLRTLLTGGDRLQRYSKPEDHIKMHNHYGPTECSVVATAAVVPVSREANNAELPSIGHPIANTQVYILDEQRQPVPIGVAGELYIGGAGVARGYLNRAELTAEKFIADPFSDKADARLYRTGDVGRWRADGNIEFLDRIDSQVKLRGFRIELGEVESVLCENSAVAQAVVLLKGERAESKQLVAYVVSTDKGETISLERLREHLKSKLPEYMVPALFVKLEALPLTVNGKIDRKALLETEGLELSSVVQYVPPQTPRQELLVRLWSKVLKREQIGIHDNFFELGGHSLLATQLISHVRDVFKVELPLRTLFEHPTIAGLVQELQQGQQAAPPIFPIERDEQLLSLSFAQQRLWFLAQLEGPSATYNIPMALRLKGALDVAALEHCLNRIVQRHEVLRTRFAMVEGMAVQIIAPHLAIPLSLIDLQELSESFKQLEVQRLVTQEAQQPFDLSTGPLLRVPLLRLAPEEHVLMLTMHHIISDGWSMGVLVKEVMAFYQAYITDTPAEFVELPIQYADFAHWQRQWLQGEVLQSHMDYWKEHLAGAPPLLELPTDYPRPSVQSFEGDKIDFSISTELTQKLEELSHQYGVTLFMTLLGAYALLLNRYSGQQDMVIGSLIANRNRRETENLIGFFVNTLVLRIDLSGNPSFEQLVERVRQVALGAYSHQDLPFEKLVEELQPQRNLSHNPIFQVSLTLNAPLEALELDDLQLVSIPVQLNTARFDIALILSETVNGLVGSWEYNNDLFEQETIERLSNHFRVLLESIVAEPGQKIQDLSLLTAPERHQLLYDFNDTVTGFPSALCIPQLFEQQVEKTPDAIALVYEQQQLTYRQLNQRANQLAHHLQSLGVGPEVIVGVCVERSIDMVVGLLGILKAGGAYLPLDPSYPQERLAFMLEDVQAPLLLTQESLADDLPANWAQMLLLEDLPDLLSTWPTQTPTYTAEPKNLVYVIYTSGSTGIPKGVMAEHSAVARLVKDSPYIDFSSQQVFFQLAPITFDAATFELWGALLNGARLALAGSNHLSLEEIAQQLQRQQVSTLWLTAGLFQVMTKRCLEAFEPVRQLLAGGDILPISEVQMLLKQWPHMLLVNGYGPTEATTFSCTYRIPTDWMGETSVPIGTPIANTQMYVLDEQKQPVPIGVVGELFIGGAGVARGYLNQPELTAEKFIADPFSDKADARLYRTGDQGRWRADGQLEYLGRKDHQVKLRGFRIELGEIEATLTQYPAVAQAVVLIQGEQADDKQLVAYIVSTNEGETISLERLREHLKTKLPEYMVPTLFVMSEVLPLTVNGKIDRKALPATEGLELSSAVQYVSPQTPTQELLAQLWSEVLKQEQVGIHDNFFELGGHSLLATQLISRMREVFEVELPLRALFGQPTVSGLAKALQQGEQAAPAIVPIVRDESLVPLSFAQQRLWFLAQLEGPSATYNIPMALRLKGALDGAALEHCLTRIVQRHEVLRTHFAIVEGMAVQIIAPHLAIPFPTINLQSLSKSSQQLEVQRLVTQEAQQPFDLSAGPLLRVTLLNLASEEHILLLNMHHIVSDGWSMGVLVKEVTTLYQAYVADMSAELAKLPIQYADFARWQRQWLQGEVLQAQVNYWKQQLNGAPHLLKLPTDRPRPAVQSFRGDKIDFSISTELTQKLQDLSRQHGVTLFMTLLGVYAVLLSRYSGQQDMVIGSPIANRNRGEIENLIGFFVNTLALRIDLSDNPSFEKLLARVRQIALGAYAHQDLPFEKLVEDLQPQRNLSHSPVFQVMFVLQNAPLEALELQSLKVEPLGSASTVAKFDLTLALQETVNGLGGSWEYNNDLFEQETIKRLSNHFRVLLESIVAEPEKKIQDLPLLTAPERHQLLYDFNDTATDFPSALCVPQLFEQQVEKTPDAIALVYEQQQLTYRQLNQKANQLAHYLQSLGVGPDVIVGLCVERSVEMVVGLLGILKAGGAYLPLDPSYPPERLVFMLEDAQASLVLSEHSVASVLSRSSVRLLLLDELQPVLDPLSKQTPICTADPGHLAYVIYTSGSTGTPKGVTVEQGNAIALLTWAINHFDCTNLQAVLASTSICFDLSVFELFAPLSCGGCVLLVSDALALLQRQLPLYPSLLNTVPSAAAALLYAGRLPESLRVVNLAGEALSPTLVGQLYQLPTVEQVYNLYGPSEDTTYSSWALMAQEADYCPIGRPIANTQMYVLDSNLQPVPIGVAGELYIGGAGVARGYLNRPELTAEKFIADPFSDKTDARLYRTGDLGRWRVNGQLEYLGRIDYQVKLRGFRIELGEIESTLNEHLSVVQVAVVVRGEQADNKQLVAYVVFTEGETTSLESLREYLKTKLPEYMVPGLFVVLESLPLTVNGKIDRKVLRSLDGLELSTAVQYVPPQTPIQELLTQLWSEVLKQEQVGIHDNFFDLGGHSLLLVELNQRLQRSLARDISLMEMFQYPTVYALARHLSTAHDLTDETTHHQLANIQAGRNRLRQRRATLNSVRENHE
jgi:amino acid adenylation domain-containing protein